MLLQKPNQSTYYRLATLFFNDSNVNKLLEI